MDVMVDIETGGTDKDAAVLSIGAAMFDVTGEGTRETERFYMPIDIVNHPDFGRKIDGGTFIWWLGQSEGARQALISRTGIGLPVALKVFFDFLGDFKPEHVWANSPDFDLVILERAARACGAGWPLKFWTYRCVRTVRTLAARTGGVAWPAKNDMVAHNALEDALYQVAVVQACFKAVRS